MSTNEPAIALVFSPEAWVERLHRHLADHGGARVRQIVLDPTLALDEAYDVAGRQPPVARADPPVRGVAARPRAARCSGCSTPTSPPDASTSSVSGSTVWCTPTPRARGSSR